MRTLQWIWAWALVVSLFAFACGVMFLIWVVLAEPLKAAEVERLNALTNAANFVLGDGDGWCSGTLISVKFRLVATANHCIDQLLKTKSKKRIGPHGEVEEVEVEDRKNIVLTQRDYSDHDLVSSKSWVARIVDYSKSTDVAILQIRRKDIPQTIAVSLLPLTSKVMAGERIWAIGNPAMLDNTIMTGIVSNTTRKIDIDGDDIAYTQFQASIYGGISGGALLNDDLQYIGTVGAQFRGTDISLAIPVEQLRKLLKRNCFFALVADTKQNRDKDDKCRGSKSLDADGSPKTNDDEDSNDYTWGGPH